MGPLVPSFQYLVSASKISKDDIETDILISLYYSFQLRLFLIV